MISRILKVLPFKTNFVYAFPDGPADGSTATGINQFSSWEPFGYPLFVLVDVTGDVISSKA